MNRQIDLVSYRSELQSKIQAIDLLLGGDGLKNGRTLRAASASRVKPERMAGSRKMSAAGRARLAAIARARWKKAKAAGKSAL